MFRPADEFDYRDVILAQLESIVSPLTDSRRAVLTITEIVEDD